MNLIELRDALAKARGPSRALSDDVLVVAGWAKESLGSSRYGGGDVRSRGYIMVDPQGRKMLPREAPDPCGSIDAAVTLVMPLLVDGTVSYVDMNIELAAPVGAGVRLSLIFNDDRPDIEIVAPNQELAWCLARVEYEIARSSTATPPPTDADGA